MEDDIEHFTSLVYMCSLKAVSIQLKENSRDKWKLYYVAKRKLDKMTLDN